MPVLVAFLLVFLVVGLAFVVVNLTLGALLRPRKPGMVKDQPYECGEEPIGTAWIQFDLRFYVVALLFVIFEVELVFFFPWATLFGKLNAVPAAQGQEQQVLAKRLLPDAPANAVIDADSALSSSWLILGEMLIFLALLLVAYAYLWRRGDLNWVRASQHQQKSQRIELPLA